MKRVFFHLMATLVVITLLLEGSSCATSAPTTTAPKPPTEAPIKIGLVSSQSGPYAAMPPYTTAAAQMAIDDVNASGGLLGRPVELIVKDDMGDPSTVAQKANELQAAGVVGIVGPFLDASALALNQWSRDNRVPATFSNPTLSLRTNEFSRYSFHAAPDSWALARVLARGIAAQNVNSIYFLSADWVGAHEIYNLFWPEMKKLKPDIIDLGVTWVGMTEMEFSNIISAVLAKKPDLILNGIAGPQYLSFIQQGQRFSLFSKTKVAGTYLLSADGVAPLGKDCPEGIQAVTYCPFYLDEKPMRDFAQAYYARNRVYPGDTTLSFYIGTLSLIEAIKKANSADPEKMIAALETMTIDTPTGAISYSDYAHQADLPIWYASSGYSKDFPSIAVGVNLTKYRSGVYPTKDEILALRRK